jgi:hypothetical protein
MSGMTNLSMRYCAASQMHLLFIWTCHQDAVQKGNTKVAVVLDGSE